MCFVGSLSPRKRRVKLCDTFGRLRPFNVARHGVRLGQVKRVMAVERRDVYRGEECEGIGAATLQGGRERSKLRSVREVHRILSQPLGLLRGVIDTATKA